MILGHEQGLTPVADEADDFMSVLLLDLDRLWYKIAGSGSLTSITKLQGSFQGINQQIQWLFLYILRLERSILCLSRE